MQGKDLLCSFMYLKINPNWNDNKSNAKGYFGRTNDQQLLLLFAVIQLVTSNILELNELENLREIELLILMAEVYLKRFYQQFQHLLYYYRY